MHYEEQFKEYDRLRRRDLARAELKAREMARQVAENDPRIVDFTGRRCHFPVMGRRTYYDAAEGMPSGSTNYHTIVVELHPAIDGDERLLIAEKIIRPQLERAGWSIDL